MPPTSRTTAAVSVPAQQKGTHQKERLGQPQRGDDVMTVRASETRATPARPRSGRLFTLLVGAASLAIVLQGLWAGLFVHEGKDYDDSWVESHARGAEAAIVLALLATVVALVQLRERRDLWLGSATLTVLLVAEAFLGGLIGDESRWTIVHFPLAMALMALAVWLPLRSLARPTAR